MPTRDEALAFHRAHVVADIHAHPSLKGYLLGRRLDESHRAGNGMSPFGMCADLPSIRDGGVRVVVSSIHIPERQLRDCLLLRGASLFAPRLRHVFKTAPDVATIEVMDYFEKALDEASARMGGIARVARSRAELQSCLDDGKIAVLHAVEGAHSLGGRVEMIDTLFARGVCLLTLAHFFDHGVSPPVLGVPADLLLHRIGCFGPDPDPTRELPKLGEQVVERMLDIGMIVDMTHSTQPARRRVLDIAHGRRPVVMSHVGVRAKADFPMNPEDDEIRAIAEGGGIVGVIFMNYWLTGRHDRDGIRHVVETIQHLVDVGGSDCVSLGSDFDGYTDPPDDLREPSDLPALTEALLGQFDAATTAKILGGNFLRLLGEAWSR